MVPLVSDYKAFLHEALFAVRAPRTTTKLYWAVGFPTMAKLAEGRLPDTFEQMLREHAAEPGVTSVYAFEQADFDTLGNESPIKCGAGAGESTSFECTSASSTLSDPLAVFSDCVCEYDKQCVLCGEAASPEAAHIIPLRAATDPALRACLEEAKLDPTSINSSHNGVRLCAAHHVAFDAYFWAPA